MKFDSNSLDALAEQLDHDAGGISLHGAIVGGLCADRQSAAYLDGLLRHALRIDVADTGAGGELRAAAALVEQELRDPDYAFALPLPGDDTTLAERACALAEWCEAFIAVFSVCLRRLDAAALSAESDEILGDIGAIAGGLDPQTLASGDEQDERDFHEIAEFVRLAALSLFAERAPPGDVVLH